MQFHLKVLLVLFLTTAAPVSAKDARSLALYHTHTGDTLNVTYYENGAYLDEGLAALRVYLADWRNGAQYDIDPGLMDILWRLQSETGYEGTWEIISAYRSPETNGMLNERSNGVAKKSLHMEGKAIDVRLRGFDTKTLHAKALELKLGGVGYYDESDFIHVDTGRVRRW